jgi:soluble lytic murein transglycosylase-like protein/rubrerythrin
MRSVIDFGELDLRGALDFAILIEEDAQLRYERLARVLGDEAGGAGAVIRAMIGTEAGHRRELVARRTALFGDAPARIEISVMDEGIEGPDDDDLPRTAREALAMSAAAERHAHDFYEAALPCLRDPAARAFFEGLMEEELEHEAMLLNEVDELDARAPAAAGACASRPTPAKPRPRETFPDRVALEAALPRFDAATRAVATSVIVRGIDEAEVAAALGVSRRSVSRKLTRFLGFARQHVAVAATAATLAGCVGNLRGAETELRGAVQPEPLGMEAVAAPARDEFVERQPEPSSVAGVAAQPRGERVEREVRSAVARRIRAEVARRMRGYDSSMHARVARTILVESRAAELDPLLVLAVIHVESAFDPDAFSRAGAVGLMQLLEPTLRAELERAGISPGDPCDPVVNVQAGVLYLRRLVRTFGHLDVALMAYNAGPNRILGHLQKGEIPQRFHEYPRRVNEELSRLRVVFGEAAPPPTAGAPTGGDGAS